MLILGNDYLIMRRSRWKMSAATSLLYTIIITVVIVPDLLQASQNYKINPKPCKVNSQEGTCMFVWECIKSEGEHIGMCMDSFMFGSCCAHNATSNVILSAASSYNSKPITHVNRYKPSHNRPNVSASTSILRPNGSGMVVIRPGTNLYNRPYHTRSTTTSTTTTTAEPPAFVSDNEVIQHDLQAQSSIATASWSQSGGWHTTTQPNFITKPKPSQWDKVTQVRPKPKPSKKPILSTNYQNTKRPSTPKPHHYQTKPTKHSTTTTSSTTIQTTRRPIPNTSRVPLPSSSSIAPPINEPVPNPIVIEPGTYTVSASRSTECGVPTVQRPETRIVGGKNAPFGRWPWQVSVRRTSFFGFSSTHRCGGAVINEQWIATAGHCVDDLLTSQIRIRVGEYDFSHVQEQLPYIERAVAKKVVHPKYNFFTYEYDLALVKLDQPLEFAPHIRPICLPATNDLLIGDNATVTGWGRLSEGGTLPSVLQEVSVPIVSNDKCKTMFLRAGRHEFIPDIFLCAGHEFGGQDSCQGDSGGPLQVKGKDGRYFLAGIISWGIGCAEANLPGVCTRISKFTPWILEVVSLPF
ncbi:serine proteinase stubble [Culicoides brevitarsis]|uniref:serine proteinase stubble n=1 Tax=Culicoides brevitarsis TaxID=469753 RepID=UPI00307B6D37